MLFEHQDSGLVGKAGFRLGVGKAFAKEKHFLLGT